LANKIRGTRSGSTVCARIAEGRSIWGRKEVELRNHAGSESSYRAARTREFLEKRTMMISQCEAREK
jgi:hypothetical protein